MGNVPIFNYSLGIQGPQGTGAQGQQGSQGWQGTPGTGAQGQQGSQGWQGTPGTGAQGQQGSQGWQGQQGFQGWQGALGIGTQGQQGFQGWQGALGIGTQGQQGFQGWQGALGIGTQGQQGSQGWQGWQGWQGALGIGTQGQQGSQGWQGWQGWQGALGIGTQGQQGSQGRQGAGASVNGTTNNGIITYNSTSGGLDVESNVTYNGTTFGIGDASNFSGVTFEVAGTTRVFSPPSTTVLLVNTGTCNVGVGNGQPQYKLDVSGDINITGSYRLNGNVIDLQGPQGFQGVQGPQGRQGFQGVQGPQGRQGFQGVQGSNAGISTYTNAGDNRILTSVSISEINAEANLTFDGLTLCVIGGVNATGDIIAYCTSDLRLKRNVVNIQSPIEKIKNINGVCFEWKDCSSIHNNNGPDVGVIAQEIQKVLPDAVVLRNNGYLAVKYEKIIPLLIESNKELLRRIEDLEEWKKNNS